MRIIGAFVFGALATFPAFAQEYCRIPHTNQVDQRATQTLHQMLQRADPAVTQFMSGVWYTEIQSPSTNQINYRYHSFTPNGLFEYQSRVCGGLTNMCNDYQGTGVYAGISQGSGQITLMIMYSDLNADHACIGSTSRVINQTTLQDLGGGQIWQKVR